jgi:hypothetical protein
MQHTIGLGSISLLKLSLTFKALSTSCSESRGTWPDVDTQTRSTTGILGMGSGPKQVVRRAAPLHLHRLGIVVSGNFGAPGVCTSSRHQKKVSLARKGMRLTFSLDLGSWEWRGGYVEACDVASLQLQVVKPLMGHWGAEPENSVRVLEGNTDAVSHGNAP